MPSHEIPPTRLEIAVTSLTDAVNAAEGGADSVEISRDLSVGGLTPALDLVAAARDAIRIPIYVLVRDHARDFVYTPAEMDTMLATVRQLQGMGVQGIVFGALTASGEMDLDAMRAMVRAAGPMSVTLHRALDACRNPQVALSRLTGIIPRVLTAGPAPTAWEGRTAVAAWVAQFGSQMEFVSSGGLTAAQLPAFIRQVRPSVVHLGGAARSGDSVAIEKVQNVKQIIHLVDL
ncbi:MAG: copper homeostasis protein CutC [Anaerolineae bacterium]|nr:copper homeostasis protein CutC [Anaerolineae bacterium]